MNNNNIKLMKKLAEHEGGFNIELLDTISEADEKELDGVLLLWRHNSISFLNSILDVDKDDYMEVQELVNKRPLSWSKRLILHVSDEDAKTNGDKVAKYLGMIPFTITVEGFYKDISLPKKPKSITIEERYTLLMMLMTNVPLNDAGEKKLVRVFNYIYPVLEDKGYPCSLLILHAVAVRWLLETL